jgi:hypothetical protein
VLTGLAMCMVIIVALIGTAYLAVYFTRRAKADLEQLLTPLAEHLNGTADVDEATVTGTWGGTIALARMAGAAAGTVRVWQVDLIDAAGGEAWNYVYSRPKKDQTGPEIDIVTGNSEITDMLSRVDRSTLEDLQPDATDWIQVEYNPEGGYVRVARPMHGRNDIPGPDRLETDLRFLKQIGDENRALQERMRSESGESTR